MFAFGRKTAAVSQYVQVLNVNGRRKVKRHDPEMLEYKKTGHQGVTSGPHNSLLQYSSINLGEKKSFISYCVLYLSSLPYNRDQMSDLGFLQMSVASPFKLPQIITLATYGRASIHSDARFHRILEFSISRRTHGSSLLFLLP